MKGSDDEENGQGWQAPKSKKGRKTKRVMMAIRTSSRVPRDGVPIATKAIQWALARDNVAGTNENSFTILNSTPNSVLQAITQDLDLESDNMGEYLDVFKTKEIARAKIAEANYKNYLEKQRKKSAPQTEEEEQEFTMGVISNDQRDYNPNPLKGGGDGLNPNVLIGGSLNLQVQK